MYLSKLRVRNYKSFDDSGELSFKPGINIIIGPNNSGKTALLEALSLRIITKPHRSEKSSVRANPSRSGYSVVDFTLTIDSAEFEDVLSAILTVPTPANGRINDAITALNQSLNTGLHIQASVIGGSGAVLQSHNMYPEKKEDTNDRFMRVSWDRHSRTFKPLENSIWVGDARKSLGAQLISPFVAKIYRFEAERMKLSQYPVGTASLILKPDASNLAEVLQLWHNRNPYQYSRFVNYVTEVIPSVKWVSAVTNEESRNIEINIWAVPLETERDDLAINLSEAGTGIGQVLAILYVAFSTEPQTIIIDEPQSFLHPGAIKRLIEILHTFKQHQYFISTHSPDVLSAAMPCTITALQYEEGVSSAKSISLDETSELRDVLTEIGVRFGDIFFANSILWVEGPTEASAFPLILKLSDRSFSGLTILPLLNTGDLRSKRHARKHAKLVFDIYSKLSGAHSLAPPVIGVILDKEDTTSQEIKELQKLSDNLLEFLPRRLYENYLLDPDAIAAVANSQENFSDSTLTSEQVLTWINGKRLSGEYLDEKIHAKLKGLTDAQWIKTVDGARLLEDLFRHFSGVVSYSKTKHSIELTAWLAENKPESLAEIRIFLESILRNEYAST